MFDILGVSQMHMFYVYDFMCWALTLKHIIDEMFVLSGSSETHEYSMIFIEGEALEHMSILCLVLSEKLWNT